MFANILFKLIAGHFLCDYPLQGDFIGKNKNRHTPAIMHINPGMKPIPWWHLMTAHAFIHGLSVLLITNSLLLALIETIIHFIIDVGKCEGYFDINIDQSFHIICKLSYAFYLSKGNING